VPGVCDGCRKGGNPPRACVNRLDVSPARPPSIASTVPAPRWWITDHFEDAQRFTELRVGEVVESLDARFPSVYRKRALLSSAWGRYGGRVMAGATLFEVERRGAGVAER
jgi:hypothetical protein